MSKPSAAPISSTLTNTTAQDQAQQNSLNNTAQGTLSQFEGPVQNSPYYKSLLATGTEGATSAYNAAKANLNQEAATAGFTPASSSLPGAATELNASEAQTLAGEPASAAQEATSAAIPAAEATANIGNEYGTEAEGYSSQNTQLEEQLQALQAQQQMGLLSALANVGGDVAEAEL